MKKSLTHVAKLMTVPIKAGFPNPAEDARGIALDLNELVLKNPVSTFYIRVDGDSMSGAGIASGDIVVVDKSLNPKNGDIVVAVVNGEFTLKHLKREGAGKAWLVAAHPNYPPIALHQATDAAIWGVVTFSIRKHR